MEYKCTNQMNDIGCCDKGEEREKVCLSLGVAFVLRLLENTRE